jgi:hypothetical protein
MRKLFFGLAFLGAMAFSNTSTIAQSEMDPPSIEDPCTDKITRKGSIIYVTVCLRRTSFIGALAGLSCDEIASSNCTFTNG